MSIDKNNYMMSLKAQLNKLCISSKEAIVDGNSFEKSKYHTYMHTDRTVDKDFQRIVEKASKKENQQLILLVGNVGDGKSYLLSMLKQKHSQLSKTFKFHNDATESNDKNKTYLDTLKEILDPFNDNNIKKTKNEKIILAINLGTLTNFIDNCGDEYKGFTKYIKDMKILESNITEDNPTENEHFQFINLTDYQIFSLTQDGPKSDLIMNLLNKITNKSDDNPFYSSYKFHKEAHENCPIKYNYELLMEDNIKKKIESLLIEIIIKFKLIVSIRTLLNFFHDLLVPSELAALSEADYIKKISKFDKDKEELLSYIFLNYLFEHQGVSDIFSCFYEIDPLGFSNKKTETMILNSVSKSFSNSAPKEKNEKLDYILKGVENYDLIIKTQIRFYALTEGYFDKDKIYDQYVKYLYDAHMHHIRNLKELYETTKKAIFVWNGTSNDEKYINFNIGCEQNKYQVSKPFSIKSAPNLGNVKKLEYLEKFSLYLNIFFKPENNEESQKIKIDYGLFKLMSEIQNGYRPNRLDKNNYVHFSKYINQLSEFSGFSDLIVFSEMNNEKTKQYKLYVDDFGYHFEEI